MNKVAHAGRKKKYCFVSIRIVHKKILCDLIASPFDDNKRVVLAELLDFGEFKGAVDVQHESERGQRRTSGERRWRRCLALVLAPAEQTGRVATLPRDLESSIAKSKWMTHCKMIKRKRNCENGTFFRWKILKKEFAREQERFKWILSSKKSEPFRNDLEDSNMSRE